MCVDSERKTNTYKVMKANEAPKKIYIQPDAQDGWFMVNNLNNTLVEYTRTDAFIEKAVEWLKLHSENDYVEYHMGVTIIHKDKFIKDFKDAIERV